MREAQHKIEITFTDRSSDLASAVTAATGLRLVESLSDEELLEAVRQRFRPKGLVVNVEPFAAPGLEPEAVEPEDA